MVKDLGALEGCETLLVFGGCYSNLQATMALIEQAKALGIRPEHSICTGDVVAYCAQPEQTVQALREWGCHVLMGNCEESLSMGYNDCGCGFEEGSACDVLSNQWFEFSTRYTSDAHKQWMGRLPSNLRFSWGGQRFSVVHGSPASLNEFVFPSMPDSVFNAHIEQTQADVVLCGHSGLPFTKKVQQGVWFNAGAIGMPANDGQAHTWFGLIHKQEGGFLFEHRALHYDQQEAARIMRSNHLNNGYAKALTTGLWPSLDILPEAEKAMTGRARS
ncbi:MAG: metallophosphoesterase family protein [Limnobacter sp.]|nr:metallophosphoesterase family protein [Limnobacter sp.]